MKFTYLNYGDNILEKIKADSKTVIVFSDYSLKNFYLRKRKKNILIPIEKIFTLDEFQKEIFKIERMVLTEAKRPLTLYRVLNRELKEKLNIQSYYDIIDFADLFFKYYKELFLSMKNEAEGLQNWQKEYIERFEILKNEYDKYLDENNFIPNDWIENIENYKDDFLKDYDKIIFADIPYFTPLMKEAVHRMENILNVEILIQIPQEDYNEKKLKIERVSLVKKNIKCQIYENSDEMSEIINLIGLLRKEGNGNEIFSPVPENSSYHKIFPKYFLSQKQNVLDDTKLYKFMKVQNELLSSLEPKKRYGIPVDELKNAFNCEIFRKIYGIDDEIIEKFKILFSAEYKYIDEKLFKSSEAEYLLKDYEEQNIESMPVYQVFYNIYSDLAEIKNYTKVDDFVEYIKEIGFEIFRENNYLDIIEKFYQGVDNMKTSEKLCGTKGFREFFSENTGAGLYTLLIKYMEGIEIKEVERDREEVLGSVKPLFEGRLKSGGKSYFTDIDNLSLPGSLKDDMIFTESQRVKNGFMTFEDKKLIAKYRFIQGIFNCEESVIFTKNIPAEEIGKSVFLDELMMKYDLKVEKNIFTKDEIFNIIRENLLPYENNLILENIYSEDYFTLKKEITDFPERKIVLGTYDVINLKGCRYRYFLDKIAKIHGEDEEIYGTSMRFLGIVTHKIFDDISKKIYMNIIKDSRYFVEEKLIDEIMETSLIENSMKIPTYMDLFFKEIMFPKIKENLFKFYREIEKDIQGKKVRTFFGEKSRSDKEPFYSDELNVFINGRADLVVETKEGEKYIIDYKTGGKKAEQLDIYSIIMFGDENSALKRIYNVIKGEYEKIDKSSITKDEIEDLFKNFIAGENYERAEKKAACSNCEYIGICRREVV